MEMPICAMQTLHGLRGLEAYLENAGQLQLAQIIRWHVYWLRRSQELSADNGPIQKQRSIRI